jgi:hypothetical protein
VHPNYQLGIDLGTTWTAASICRDGDTRPESVALSTTGAAVASVVFLAPDGTMLTGEPAQRRALSEPARVVREFKRRIGDGTPIVVGGHPVPAEVLSARFVARIVAEVAHREDAPPQSVAVTHPVEWGDHKKRSFAAALAAEGLPDVLFLTEPQAAAVGYASEQRVEGGRTVAVYDLGGGTFDAAVVRKAADGTFALLGHPAGIERLGGVDFDDAVFAHVREAVGAAWDELDPDDPAVRTAVAGLRRECTAAKETLSADTEVMIPVLLPGLHTMVRLGRAEFEDMIRPAVAETVEALRRAVASAAVEPGDLDAVLLVGGSWSRRWCRPSSGAPSRWTPTRSRSWPRARRWPRGTCRHLPPRPSRRSRPGLRTALRWRSPPHRARRPRPGGRRAAPACSPLRAWRWRWRSGCRRRWRPGSVSGRWRPVPRPVDRPRSRPRRHPWWTRGPGTPCRAGRRTRARRRARRRR